MKHLIRSRFVHISLIVVLSLIVLLFILDVIILPWIIHSGAEVQIPNVVGQTLQDATTILENAGLKPVLSGQTKSDKIKPGHVVIQNPAAKSVVREGRNIYLTISGGEEEIQMPNLRGRSLRDTKFTLERYDLQIGTIIYEASELPEETVIAQSIPVGNQVKKNSIVSITVSSGKQVLQIGVPYIVGLNLQEAQNRLSESGLRVGTITYKKSSELLPNTVISQSPRAGEMVDANTPIDVTIVH